MLPKTLISIDQNVDALFTRIPSNAIAIWKKANIHQVKMETPSMFDVVRTFHTCGIIARGFMNMKALMMILKNLRCSELLSFEFRKSIMATESLL